MYVRINTWLVLAASIAYLNSTPLVVSRLVVNSQRDTIN